MRGALHVLGGVLLHRQAHVRRGMAPPELRSRYSATARKKSTQSANLSGPQSQQRTTTQLVLCSPGIIARSYRRRCSYSVVCTPAGADVPECNGILKFRNEIPQKGQFREHSITKQTRVRYNGASLP